MIAGKNQLIILAETTDFVAVNKPAGLLSIPDREGEEISMKALLRDRYDEIYTVHRLDRETSGVIVFARNEETHNFLSRAFQERAVEKFYTGIVSGVPAEPEKTINAPIAQHSLRRNEMIIHKRGKESITDYKVLESFGKYAYLSFQIHTGRTHQIRIHMQYAGHPLLCDPVYGDGQPIRISSLKKNYHLSKNELEERPILNRVALHARLLKFRDQTGKAFELEAEEPKDMSALLQQLRKWKGGK